MEMLDLTYYHVWFHFLITLCQEGVKPSEYCTLHLPMVGIEPGLPEQQVSALNYYSVASQQY